MALVVNTNVPSIASQRFLMESRKEMETSMERLSSGLRINSAADDAAGLAISTRMDTQIRGLNVAIRNANDGISLTQTAEGAMQEVTDMLQRMRELSMQAAHAVNNDDDRSALDAEVQQLKAEIDRIADSTAFNGQNILDGSFNRSFQIGLNSDDTLRIGIAAINTAALGMVGESGSNESGSLNELVSARLNVSSIDFSDGDVLINGQELSAFDGGSEDIYDLITNISNNVDNVQASAFNTVVAKTIGSGVVREDQVAVKVAAIGTSTDAWYQPERVVTLESSDSMEEMVANINKAFINNEVVASINTDGKLVLSNNTGATISIADASGTTTAFDGATGFEVDSTITFPPGVNDYATVQQGFLRLTSTDDSPIEITVGNKGLAAPGSVSDIQSLGFNAVDEDPTGNFYTMTGARLDSTSLADTFGKSTATEQADLTINGVAIYDEDLTAATNTFQGKLDMINAFSDETGVVASAQYERVFDMSGATLVVGDTLDLNGTTIDVDNGTIATIDTLAANINSATNTTGISATINGNNLILKGDGVQTVNVSQNTYELSASTTQGAARRSADTATLEQVVAFHADDIEAGRVLTLTIDTDGDPDGTNDAITLLDITAGQSRTYTYTVQDGDTVGDVHTAFYDLLVMDLHGQGVAGEFSAEELVGLGNAASGVDSDTLAQLYFLEDLGVGQATITLGVTQTPAAERALYDGSTANFTDYGAIRLQSVDLTPISVELNEGQTTGALAGLVEMNVGDTTYDVNAPTFQMTGAPGVMVSGLSVTTSEGAVEAISVIDAALQMISDTRSNLGAIENRLDHTISNLANVVENTAASKSRIMDADFAAEAAALARAQVLQQAGTAMLAQANAAPQNVLSLLG